MTDPKPVNAWQAANLPLSLPLYIRRNIDAGPGGCWLWNRSKSPDGYGWASFENRTHQAHRLVYRLLRGEVPEGLVLDHLCRVRHCVNPAHLEPVTMRENLRRGNTTTGMVRCARGHEFSDYYGRQRRCLVCKKEWDRQYKRPQRR